MSTSTLPVPLTPSPFPRSDTVLTILTKIAIMSVCSEHGKEARYAGYGRELSDRRGSCPKAQAQPWVGNATLQARQDTRQFQVWRCLAHQRNRFAQVHRTAEDKKVAGLSQRVSVANRSQLEDWNPESCNLRSRYLIHIIPQLANKSKMYNVSNVYKGGGRSVYMTATMILSLPFLVMPALLLVRGVVRCLMYKGEVAR